MISSCVCEVLVKATRSASLIVKTIPEPVLGLDTDLGQTISFQFSSSKSGDKNCASQDLVRNVLFRNRCF